MPNPMLNVEDLRRAAASDDPEPAIDGALGAAPAEAIASVLAQTIPADRFLRIVLRNRLAKAWPVTDDRYQDSCFFLAAERVRLGGRAYASELGIPGNEYATLNETVLERQIRSPDGNHRIAAAQMMRPPHLHLLEGQLKAELDDQVRAALALAGRRIAGERGSPVSTLLTRPERLAQLVRLFGQNKGWLRWSTAAECFGAEGDELRSAADQAPAIHTSGAYFFVGERVPPQLDPEFVDNRAAALRLAYAALSPSKELALKDARTLAELWLRAQTPLWLADVRYWLGLPTVASAFEGVVLRADETLLKVHGGKVTGDADHNAMVVIHHPRDGAEALARMQAPAWQTDRPIFTSNDLPELTAAAPIELAAWNKRTKALGYADVRAERAVIHTVRSVGGVQIHHSGHGEGYGTGPQKILSVSYPRHSAAAVSEVVWDVRRLLGIDPLEPKR